MAIYAVIASTVQPELESRINSLYPTAFQRVNERAWLIEADATAPSLSEQLELRGGGRGLVLVIQVVPGAVAGWEPKALWDWLALKAAKTT